MKATSVGTHPVRIIPTGLPLDFDTLLAPIAGSEPAGSSSVYLELRSQLDDLRKELNPDDFDKDDPQRPERPQYADWLKVEELARHFGLGDVVDTGAAAAGVGLVHLDQFQAGDLLKQFAGLKAHLLAVGEMAGVVVGDDRV